MTTKYKIRNILLLIIFIICIAIIGYNGNDAIATAGSLDGEEEDYCGYCDGPCTNACGTCGTCLGDSGNTCPDCGETYCSSCVEHECSSGGGGDSSHTHNDDLWCEHCDTWYCSECGGHDNCCNSDGWCDYCWTYYCTVCEDHSECGNSDCCDNPNEVYCSTCGTYYCSNCSSCNCYTITYNINGGSGTAPISQTKVYGTALTLRTYSGTKTGYTFKGWSTSSSATTATWASGGTMSAYAISSDTTLYAVWSPNSYTITYNANGGSATAPDVQTKTYGTALTLRTYSGTKTNYTFQGWSTSSTTTTATWSSGGTMSATYNLTSNITLYAVWKPNGYTVSYNANGGSATAPSSQTKLIGSTLTLQTYSGTKTGYTYKGWSTSSTATTATWASGGTMGANDISANTTLYAVWSPNTYTVTYDYNGATSGNSTSSKTVTYNSTYGTLATPSKTVTYTITLDENGGSECTDLSSTANYTFNGWYLSESSNNGTGTKVTSTSTVSTASNHTIYAAWSSTTGSSVTLPNTSREGYTFNGWYTASTGGTKIGGSGTTYSPTASTTLYAQWTINSYTLTVNPNGGTWNSSTGTQTFTQNYNTTKTIANPTRTDGYTVSFDGNDGTAVISSMVQTISFTGWTLTGSGSISGTTYTYGAGDATITAQYTRDSITLPSATKTGSKCIGWYTASYGGTKVGEVGDTYLPEADIKLYAQWERIQYTITATAGDNGSISPAGVTTLDSQSNQTYVIIANDGYQIDTVKVDGVEVEARGCYIFENILSNRTIEATFKEEEVVISDKYTLKKNLDGMALDTEVAPGVEVVLEYVPQINYTFEGWVVNSGGVKIANPKDLMITFTMPAKPVEITATISK